MMAASLLGAFYLKKTIPIGQFQGKVPPSEPYIIGFFVAAGLVVLFFHIFDMYKLHKERSPLVEAVLVFVLVSAANIILMGVTFLYRGFSFSRLMFSYFWTLEFLLLGGARFLFRALWSGGRTRGGLNGRSSDENKTEKGDISPQNGRKRTYLLFKRAIDVLFSLGGLFLLSPLFALTGVLIRIGSKGSALYCHRRVGRGGKLFYMLKFRSMVSNADKILLENPSLAKEYKSKFKLQNDPRITSLGRFLRKTSLDELPQLINVVVGDMSIVGPRPVTPEELEKHSRWSDRLLEMRPGITGMWQVSGRNALSYSERVKYNVYYARYCSIGLDLKIMFRTLTAVLRFSQTS
ncbi:MAG: sugar transferase [Planctomycetota bacterium]|nr:sugar transferase [Planctomycetota bacterium]